jgi:hypothetical protein
MERRYLLVVVGCVLAAGLALVLASVLDVPALRFVAVGLLAAAVVAREVGAWGGQRVALMVGAVLVVIALAYAVQRLSG